MSATATNPIRQISSIISSIGFISEKDRSYSLSDHISYLLKAYETSEPKIKAKIENHLVKLGKKAVPSLVSKMLSTTGPTRGMIAMALIRIGSSSINYLEKAAFNNPEFKWISDYVITEIKGTQIKVEPVFEQALVG